MLLAAIFFLLLALSSARAYTEVSTLVTVEVNPDATAHVHERYSLFLTNDSEVEVFENLRKFGPNTLAGWKRFLPILRYHVAGSFTPGNTRVSARRLFDIGARSAAIELDYDAPVALFKTAQVAGRTTKYELLQEFLAFDRSANEIILSPTTALEFVLPRGSVLVKTSVSPPASSFGEGRIQWVGPLTGSWSLAYTVEKPLGEEVSEYFTGLFANAFSQIPVLAPLALLLLVAAFLYNKYVRTG